MNRERGALTLWRDLCASLESARAAFLKYYCTGGSAELTTRTEQNRFTLDRSVVLNSHQRINIQVDLTFKAADYRIEAISSGLDRAEGQWIFDVRADQDGAYLICADERMELDRISEMILEKALFCDGRKPVNAPD